MNTKPDMTNTIDWLKSFVTTPPPPADRFITQNCMITPDNTTLISSHRHDYQQHTDDNGKMYMVDGGCAYIRQSVHQDSEDLNLWSDSPFEEIRNKLLWGSYGKSGKEKLHSPFP